MCQYLGHEEAHATHGLSESAARCGHPFKSSLSCRPAASRMHQQLHSPVVGRCLTEEKAAWFAETLLEHEKGISKMRAAIQSPEFLLSAISSVCVSTCITGRLPSFRVVAAAAWHYKSKASNVLLANTSTSASMTGMVQGRHVSRNLLHESKTEPQSILPDTRPLLCSLCRAPAQGDPHTIFSPRAPLQ